MEYSTNPSELLRQLAPRFQEVYIVPRLARPFAGFVQYHISRKPGGIVSIPGPNEISLDLREAGATVQFQWPDEGEQLSPEAVLGRQMRLAADKITQDLVFDMKIASEGLRFLLTIKSGEVPKGLYLPPMLGMWSTFLPEGSPEAKTYKAAYTLQTEREAATASKLRAAECAFEDALNALHQPA